jgi:hypothetical protein
MRSLQKISTQLRLANLCVNAPIRQILHRLSCSNETVRNIPKDEFGQFCIDFCAGMKLSETPPKHEFCVEWIGSDALVAKNSNRTSISELVC